MKSRPLNFATSKDTHTSPLNSQSAIVGNRRFPLFHSPLSTMASSLCNLNQLRCSTLSLTPPTPSIPPPRTVAIWSGKPRSLLADIPRPVLCVRAIPNDDEWGAEKAEDAYAGVAVAEETEKEKLKKALVNSFYGTDRGLKATSDTRAEIVERITQLEALNPNPAPTDALTLLNGKWILA